MDSRNVIYLTIVFIASFLETAIAAIGRKECHLRMSFYTHVDCCKDVVRPDKNFDLEFWECRRLPYKKHPACDTDLCIAKKRGFLNEDLTINKVALSKEVQEEFKDNPELVKAIEEKCINGDVGDYGEPDSCQVVKTRYCIDLQSALMCTSWDEEGDYCSSVNKTVELCKQVV